MISHALIATNKVILLVIVKAEEDHDQEIEEVETEIEEVDLHLEEIDTEDQEVGQRNLTAVILDLMMTTKKEIIMIEIMIEEPNPIEIRMNSETNVETEMIEEMIEEEEICKREMDLMSQETLKPIKDQMKDLDLDLLGKEAEEI